MLAGADGSAGSAPATTPVAEAAVAARVAFGVASWATLAALSLPTGLAAPTLRMPTFAATAPLAAVTKIAVAPAKVSARCLFMRTTVENRNPTTPSRMVKNWQSRAAKGPETSSQRSCRPLREAQACHP